VPAGRSPDPAVIPLPDATTEDTVGVVVSICGPVWVSPANDRSASVPLNCTVAPLRLTAVTARAAVFWPAPDRVAEGQRVGAGATGISRGASIIKSQRRECRLQPSRHHSGRASA